MYTSPIIAALACREMHIKSLIKFIDESLVTLTLGIFASGSFQLRGILVLVHLGSGNLVLGHFCSGLFLLFIFI